MWVVLISVRRLAVFMRSRAVGNISQPARVLWIVIRLPCPDYVGINRLNVCHPDKNWNSVQTRRYKRRGREGEFKFFIWLAMTVISLTRHWTPSPSELIDVTTADGREEGGWAGDVTIIFTISPLLTSGPCSTIDYVIRPRSLNTDDHNKNTDRKY